MSGRKVIPLTQTQYKDCIFSYLSSVSYSCLCHSVCTAAGCFLLEEWAPSSVVGVGGSISWPRGAIKIFCDLATWRTDNAIFSWFAVGVGSLMAVSHQLLSRHEKGFNLLLWIWFQLHSGPKISFKLRLFEQFPFFTPLVIFAYRQWIMPKYSILRRPCCSEIIFF